MKANGFAITAAALAIALAASGCGHRLVASNDEKAVKVYDSQDVYTAALDIQNAVKKMGPQSDPKRNFIRMLDSMVQGRELRECDAGTSVKIISQNDTGAQVEILEGPNKGYKGFVPKENIH